MGGAHRGAVVVAMVPSVSGSLQPFIAHSNTVIESPNGMMRSGASVPAPADGALPCRIRSDESDDSWAARSIVAAILRRRVGRWDCSTASGHH